MPKFLVKLVLAPLLLFSAFINFLGLGFVGFFGRSLGRFLYFIGFRKKIVMDNLELALGDELTLEQRESMARAVYDNIGITFVEIARNFSMGREQMAREMNIRKEDAKILDEMKARGQGCIVISAHVSNWELFGMGVACHGYPVAIVVKRMTSPLAQELIEQRRKRTGVTIIYPGNTLNVMTDEVRAGKFIGFMVDQNMPGKKGVRANFFGVPAHCIRGLSKVVKETQCPIVPICAFRKENGEQEVRMLDFLPYIKAEDHITDPKERELREEWLNAQQYQTAVEKLIRHKPEQWLWIHRRWKADRKPLNVSTAHKEQTV